MNIQNIEKKEKNMATFEVKVPADVFDNAVNEVYKKNKNHLYVAGFRKGKAPRAVIEGMYGKEVFYPDAIEALAQDAFEAGRADCGFECVGAPSLIDQKVTEDKELIYTFEVGMYPEVELGQYKGLEVPQNHEAFDESKVDEEMHNVQKRNARLLDVEREAKMGDHVTIDFAGFIDGEQFDGGTAEDYDLELGSNTFVPGFEEQIVGMKTGDGAGRQRGHLQSHRQERQGARASGAGRRAGQGHLGLRDHRGVPRPRPRGSGEGIHRAAGKLDEQLRNYISTMGISPELTREQVLASMGLDEKTFQEIMRPQAVFELQTDLLLDAIVKAENIELDDGELDETYNKMAEEYKMEVDKIKQYVDEKIIVLDMKRRKAAQLIRDTAVDKEPEAKEEAAETKEEAAE